MKILIVDDIKDQLYLLETLLKGNGYAVLPASNGADALEKLRNEGADMIISDILMPVMDGFQFLREIRGDDQLKEIPFVFYTATYTDQEDEEFALRIGADKLIRKPTDPDEFLKVIQGVIKDKRNGKITQKKPAAVGDRETFKLYSERLVKKLEKKMIDLEKEVETRKTVEKRLRLSEEELSLRNQVNTIFLTIPGEQMFEEVLKLVLRALKSEYGTFGYFAEDGSFIAPAVSRKIYWEKCNVPEKEIIFQKGTFSGIWGRAIKEKKTLISNEGPFNVPEGHIPIQNTMVTPIIFHGEVISAIHLANKPGGYSEKDRTLLEMIGNQIAPVFNARLQRDKKEKERNQIEAALERGKREWEISFDAISDWVCLIDRERRILRTNRAVEKFVGVPPSKAIGQTCCKVTHGTEEPIRGCPYQKMLQTNSRETIDLHLPEEDRWLAVTLDPVRDRDGNLVGAVHVVRDITKLKKMEEEQLKAKKLESLGILAGGIAHDFNNLLMVILGNIDLAKTYAQPGSKIAEILSEAKEGSLQAKDLTQRFLTFSGGGDPFKETGSLAKLIEYAPDFVLAGSNIKTELSIPDNLWLVEFDEDQMRQVFSNLIINADEALPQGGTIMIRAENVTLVGGDAPGLKEGKYVRVSIEDDGAGIPEKDKGKIFDPYFSTKEMGGQRGMGLGLSVCHSIIKKHGGSIEVESEVGVGTTILIYLPAVNVKDEKGVVGRG